MHPLIETHREQIAALCRKYGVRRLEVFGSILRMTSTQTQAMWMSLSNSHRDLQAADFVNTSISSQSFENLFGRPVDLVELHAMESMRLKRLIERSMVPVYAAPA